LILLFRVRQNLEAKNPLGYLSFKPEIGWYEDGNRLDKQGFDNVLDR
jgi:hypothetical protein